MPKMSHSIEGWIGSSALATGAPPASRVCARKTPPSPNKLGKWKYQTVRPSRWIGAFSVLFSIGLHAFALLGFNDRTVRAKPIVVDDSAYIQIAMPDLEEEKIDPVEILSDSEAVENIGIVVPMLTDLPTFVPLNSFVQPLDFTPALPNRLENVSLSTIPVNIDRTAAAAQKLGKIFDISQLDRQPQPIIQQAPIFPFELKKEYAESNVLVGFIINTKGDVVSPYAIRADNHRFAEAALVAIAKWKFRPGYRGGRPVNTRTQIEVRFRVTDDD